MWNRRNRLGIALSRQTLSVSYHNGWGKLLDRAETAHQVNVAAGDLTGLSTALGPLVDALPAQARRADTLVSVGLPDPLFQQATLHFEDFPKSDAEARALVCWRMCSDLQLDPDNMQAGYQITARGRGVQTSILAQLVPKTVAGHVTTELWQTGLVPTSIDALSSALCPRPKKGQAAAVYWQGGGWWSLRCFDANGAPAPHFSAWLGENGTAAPSAQILRRIKRVLGATQDIKSLNLCSHAVAPSDLVPLADLAQDLSLSLTTRSVASWKGAASLTAGGTS